MVNLGVTPDRYGCRMPDNKEQEPSTRFVEPKDRETIIGGGERGQQMAPKSSDAPKDTEQHPPPPPPDE